MNTLCQMHVVYHFYLLSFDICLSIQFWKFAITGAEDNTELKLWSCETWACLQTIRYLLTFYDFRLISIKTVFCICKSILFDTKFLYNEILIKQLREVSCICIYSCYNDIFLFSEKNFILNLSVGILSKYMFYDLIVTHSIDIYFSKYKSININLIVIIN